MNAVLSKSREQLKIQQNKEKDDLISLFQNQDNLKVGTYVFFAYVIPNHFSHTLLRLVEKKFDKKGIPVTFYFNYITEKSKELYKFTKKQLIDLIGKCSFVKVSTDKQYIMQFVKKSKKSIPPKYGTISEQVLSPFHPSKPDSIYENTNKTNEINDDTGFVMNKSDIKNNKEDKLSETKKKFLALYNPTQNKRKSNKKQPRLESEENQIVLYKPKSNSQTKKNNETQLVAHNTELDNVSNKVSPNTNLWLNAHKLGLNLVPVKPPKSPRKIKNAYHNNEEIEYNPEILKKRSSEKNLLKNSHSSSSSTRRSKPLLLENGKPETGLMKRAPRNLTMRNNNNLNAAKTKKNTPTGIMNNITNVLGLGALFGVNQKKSKSPGLKAIEISKRERRRQLLAPTYKVGEEKRKLKEAMEVSSKELR
jgi:hypothetical protein